MDGGEEKVTQELETKKSHIGLDEILHDWNPRLCGVDTGGSWELAGCQSGSSSIKHVSKGIR